MTALGDILASAGGAPVNRPALNAAVMQGQAMAGLRTAQTEDAMLRAQQMREEMDAGDQLEGVLGGLMGPDGKTPLLSPSQAKAVAVMAKNSHGNAKDALAALQEGIKANAMGTLGNPAQLGTPAATAASQVTTGKLAEPFEVHPEYAVPAGVPQPTVQETPGGQANVAEKTASAQLHTQEATHPELFHPNANTMPPNFANDVAQFIHENPNSAQNIRSLVANGSWQVIHAMMHPELYATGAAPGAPGAAPGAAPATMPGSIPSNGITPAPGVSYHEQAAIRDDFARGLGARQATALNTMIQHSNLFDAIADSLGNGQFTPSNYIQQLWAKTFGSAAPSNLQIAGSFLGREAVRATVNSGAGTGQERELAVSDSSSPDMLHQAAQTLRSLAAGQIRSLDLRARRGGVDITQLLGPEAQAAFGMHSQTAPNAAGPVTGAVPNAGGPNPADPLGIRGFLPKPPQPTQQ